MAAYIVFSAPEALPSEDDFRLVKTALHASYCCARFPPPVLAVLSRPQNVLVHHVGSEASNGPQKVELRSRVGWCP